MKEKHRTILITFTLAILIYYIFNNNALVTSRIKDSFELWYSRVFPSLFPMIIVNDILIANNVPELLNKSIGMVFQKIFHISSYSSFIFIMSLISGCPNNAILVKSFLNQKKITSEEATKILSFTVFQNPLFLYNMLSLSFNQNTTIKLIILNYLTNIILGILIRNREINKFIPMKSCSETFILSNSINNAFKTLTMILGTIILFNLIEFKTSNEFINILLNGILEITDGLAKLPSISNEQLKTYLAIIFISSGGLCIQSQIKSIISDTSINYSKFIKYRIVQLCILLAIKTYINI